MVVIADASPLNYLILIGEAHLLPRLFGRVLIPTAVFLELRHPAAPQLVADWMASPPDWLSVHVTPLAAQPPVVPLASFLTRQPKDCSISLAPSPSSAELISTSVSAYCFAC